MRGIDIHAHLWPQSYLQGAAKGDAWHGLEHMLLDSTAVAGAVSRQWSMLRPCRKRHGVAARSIARSRGRREVARLRGPQDPSCRLRASH